MKQFKKIIKELYHKRDPYDIKSDFGRSLLIGGSTSYPNAIVIAAQLAGCAGNGYTALSVPDDIYPIVATRSLPTQIFEDTSDLSQVMETVSKYDSVLFGNGIACSDQDEALLCLLIKEYSGILVLDAGALTMLSQMQENPLAQKNPDSKIIMTPHLGEVKKLLSITSSSRDPKDYLDSAIDYCKKYGIYMLLKSYYSILVSPNGEHQASESCPTPILAKAGSGDGLAGYLTALLSYATKLYSLETVILFADEMIHEAAWIAQREKSAGFGSILSVPQYIDQVINSIL